jgi:serine/threonine protein kinase
MTLEAGTQLGAYEILSPLGAGGMGEVYRAQDPKLGREIAVKLLPEHLSNDSERVARFQREAKVLASLSHPNIAAVHGFEESKNVRFLVMELVEGETLAERLRHGAMPVDEALEVCKQIGEALEAAHEHGVIHRDLKPANVKVTADGTVKVLDFGLAKVFAGETSATEIAESPTITIEHTRPGVVLGTAAYMSPEQARGKPLDKRTDIWSFGCVLYECLTGRRAFDGETTSDVLAKILEHDPDFERLPHNTPLAIRTLLRHCLEKDRRQRLRDTGDAALELQEAIATRAWSTSALAAATHVPAYEKRKFGMILAAAMAFALGAAVSTVLWRAIWPSPPPTVSRLSVAIPSELRVTDPGRLSPNGRTIAWVARERTTPDEGTARSRIYVRPIDRYDTTPLRGTEGVQGFEFSPDSRWLAFVAPISVDSNKKVLAKVPVDGRSPPLKLTDWRDEWDSPWGIQFVWAGDSEIVILAETGRTFTRVPTAGGLPKPTVQIRNAGAAAYVGGSAALPNADAVLLDLYGYAPHGFQSSVALLNLVTAEMHVLIADGSRSTYAPTGHLLFSRGETLLGVPFSAEQLELTGAPTAILAGLRTQSSWEYGDFCLAKNGTLAYASGGRIGAQRHIVFVDRTAERIETWSKERRPFEDGVSISPEGQQIAVTLPSATGLYEVWISDVDNPLLRRLGAAADADCFGPAWSPDGQRLAYGRIGLNEQDGIYWRRTDGSDSPKRIIAPDSPDVELLLNSWSPDGSHLLVERIVGRVARSIFLVSLAPGESKDGQRKTLLPDSYNQSGAEFSPDGKWIAYSSDETGRDEVYLRAFRDDTTLGPAVPITTTGGSKPAWAHDGKTLFYQQERRVMAVEVTPGATVPASQPRVALDYDRVRSDPDEDYSVLPDGRLAVIQMGEEEGDITRVNLVLNWLEELKQKAPVE